jgi:hypothetical protein
MVLPFKKLLSKLEIPKNDWVLSRFGGCEPPSDPVAAAELGSEPIEEEAPVSQAPTSVAARLFNRWFDQGAADDVSVPPQSCARLSSNASEADALEFSEHPEEEHKSRAS